MNSNNESRDLGSRDSLIPGAAAAASLTLFGLAAAGVCLRARYVLALGALAAALTPSSRAAAQAPVPFVELPCKPEGEFKVICGQRHPEDLVRVPGSRWVVASWYDNDGGLRAINIDDQKTVALYPSDTAQERHDRATYATCPGALTGADRLRYYTGIALKAGKEGIHNVYAIHRGNRTSVEIFELDVRGSVPQATWIGCAVAPEGAYLNSVTPTPEGGFIASNYYTMGPDPAASRKNMEAGGISGQALEWRPDTGWAEVAGSEASGANGIELSADGKWLYVNEFGSRSFFRISRGSNPPQRDSVKVPFRPDNVRWASDGSLLVAGRVDGGTWVVRIDPKTLETTRLAELPDTPTFFNASVATQIDDTIWVGTSRADRIVIIPAQK